MSNIAPAGVRCFPAGQPLRRGDRCQITLRGITATGTIRGQVADFEVELDGTGHRIWIPLEHINPIPKETAA